MCHWLCISLALVSLSLRPNGGCQTIELELCPRVSLLANTSLTSCHWKNCKGIAKILPLPFSALVTKKLLAEILPILVSLLATEKLQGNCRNLAQQSIEGKRSAVVQQSEVHHRFNRLCIITTRLGAQLRLWAKMGAGKVLWVSNNCTSRYSNCSYNQTPNSQTLLWINWLKNMAGCPKWEAKHPCRAETMDGGTKSEWELLRRPEEKGCGDHVVLHGLWISIQFRKLKSDSSLACYSV